MPAALPTREELKQQLRTAYAARILAEDRGDLLAAMAAETLFDTLLAQLADLIRPSHVDV